jgi:hypothetical protein
LTARVGTLDDKCPRFWTELWLLPLPESRNWQPAGATMEHCGKEKNAVLKGRGE